MTKLVHHCSPAMQGIEMHQILFHTQFTLPSFYIALLTAKTPHFVAANQSTSHSRSAQSILLHFKVWRWATHTSPLHRHSVVWMLCKMCNVVHPMHCTLHAARCGYCILHTARCTLCTLHTAYCIMQSILHDAPLHYRLASVASDGEVGRRTSAVVVGGGSITCEHVRTLKMSYFINSLNVILHTLWRVGVVVKRRWTKAAVVGWGSFRCEDFYFILYTLYFILFRLLFTLLRVVGRRVTWAAVVGWGSFRCEDARLYVILCSLG